MKNNRLFSRIGVAMVIALLISSVQYSFATGTQAGTTITNTASVTFNDGANVKNKTSNTVSMYVGHKVAASFTPASGSANTYDNVTFYHPIELTNSSNWRTDYTVSFNSPAGYTLSLIKDDNNDGIHQPGETTVVSTKDSIGENASKKYFIKGVVGTLANGNVAAVTVTFTNASVDSAAGKFVVVNPAAAFSYTLTSTIVKPVIGFAVNGTAPSPLIPGAPFNFGVTLSNTGTATPYGVNPSNGSGIGDSVQFTYTVPANFQFTGGASGTFAISPSGLASYLYNGTSITVTVDTSLLTPAASISFTLPTIIDQSQNNGTGPNTSAGITSTGSDFGSLSYSNPQTGLTSTPSATGTIFSVATTVAASKGGKWTVTPANTNSAANETVEYIFTLKNMGNTSATFTIADVLDGGDYNTDHLVAETSNGTDLGAGATASVNAGATIQIYVRVTVPGAASVAETIARKITVTSGAAGTIWTGSATADYEHTITTTVIAATFDITLAAESISGTGTTTNPAPGDVVTFSLTVANSGATPVTSVVISNLIPTNMTFVVDGFAVGYGITIDNVNVSNLNDGDDAHFDGSSVKTNSTFGVSNGVTKVIRYKCSVN